MRTLTTRRSKAVIITAWVLGVLLLANSAAYSLKLGFYQRLPILMYHHILSESENQYHTDNPYVVSLEAFEEQMRWLYENGYKTVTSEELLSFLNGGDLPGKRVMLTFDDGYYSNFTHAYPILKKYGFTAVMFVVTSWISDEIRPFDPDKLAFINQPEMSENSDVFEYASHTQSMHRQIDGVPALLAGSREEITLDIKASLDYPLISEVGFSYPYGKHDDKVIEVLKELGIEYAVTTKAGYVTASSDPYKLPRLSILRETDISGFIAMVTG